VTICIIGRTAVVTIITATALGKSFVVRKAITGKPVLQIPLFLRCYACPRNRPVEVFVDYGDMTG
jgi:hypothetical protein